VSPIPRFKSPSPTRLTINHLSNNQKSRERKQKAHLVDSRHYGARAAPDVGVAVLELIGQQAAVGPGGGGHGAHGLVEAPVGPREEAAGQRLHQEDAQCHCTV